jgi:hypothetical protein
MRTFLLAVIFASACTTARAAAPDSKLLPPKLTRMDVGVTKPEGWLKDELTLQARGLSGQLPTFWNYFNDSKWLGTKGSEPEQFIPYYINGLFPLSFQIDDPNLSALRDRYVEYILGHQNVTGPPGNESGWLGPPITAASGVNAHNYWSKYLAVQAFQSYAEATQDKRVPKALAAHFRQFHKQLTSHSPPLNASRWGFARYSDGIVGVQWMIDHVDLLDGDTAFLWELMREIRIQADSIMASEDHTWQDFFVVGRCTVDFVLLVLLVVQY